MLPACLLRFLLGTEVLYFKVFVEKFHSNRASLSVFLFNYLQPFAFLFELQIWFSQCSSCFCPCHPLSFPPSILPQSRHNRCCVKKGGKISWFNVKISKLYVYRKAPCDGAVRSGSLSSAWATCVLLISVHEGS